MKDFDLLKYVVIVLMMGFIMSLPRIWDLIDREHEYRRSPRQDAGRDARRRPRRSIMEMIKSREFWVQSVLPNAVFFVFGIYVCSFFGK